MVALLRTGCLRVPGLVVALALVGLDGGCRGRHPAAEPTSAYVLAAVFHPKSDPTQPSVRVLEIGQRIAVVTEFTGTAPAWSPDGRSLAFASGGGEGPAQVYVADATGGHRRPLDLGLEGAPTPVAWSPNGSTLYVGGAGEGGGGYRRLWSFDPARGERAPLSGRETQSSEFGAMPSPDGSWIAFSRMRDDGSLMCDVLVVRADGSTERALTRPPHLYRLCGWTPDGQWLYVTSSRASTPAGFAALRGMLDRPGQRDLDMGDLLERGASVSLYRMRPDGSGNALLVRGTPYIESAAAAPSGGLLAYDSVVPPNYQQVVVAASDGTGPRSVSGAATRDHYPKWSPDGRKLAWLRTRGEAGTDIVVLDLASGQQTVLPRNEAVETYDGVAWRPFVR